VKKIPITRLLLWEAITVTLAVLMVVGFWYQPGWLVIVRIVMSLILFAAIAAEAFRHDHRQRMKASKQ
jgi:ABC-type transport system involved in Fe-S cluster assembly fused permease/ATPase subunit